MKCGGGSFPYDHCMNWRGFVQQHGLNVLTGVLFALAVWRIGVSPELPAVLVFIFGGVLLAAIDWKVQRLPSKIVYATFAGVAAGLVFASLVEWDWVPLATALVGAALFANAFFLLWLGTTKFAGITVIGLGDVRLAAVLGLILGWYGLPAVLAGAIVGHVFAIVLVAAMALRDRRFHVRYSFGPALVAGALSVVLLAA